MKKFIKSQDMFGQQIMLNFNNRGSAHNTFVGGVASLLIYSFISWYTGYHCHELLTWGNNMNSSSMLIEKLGTKRRVNMADTQYLP